jgi:hypothetical protein
MSRRYLGMPRPTGDGGAGKLADLALLANPLLDIRNTRRVAAVVANGLLYEARARAKLLRRPGSAVGAADPSGAVVAGGTRWGYWKRH